MLAPALTMEVVSNYSNMETQGHSFMVQNNVPCKLMNDWRKKLEIHRLHYLISPVPWDGYSFTIINETKTWVICTSTCFQSTLFPLCSRCHSHPRQLLGEWPRHPHPLWWGLPRPLYDLWKSRIRKPSTFKELHAAQPEGIFPSVFFLILPFVLQSTPPPNR